MTKIATNPNFYFKTTSIKVENFKNLTFKGGTPLSEKNISIRETIEVVNFLLSNISPDATIFLVKAKNMFLNIISQAINIKTKEQFDVLTSFPFAIIKKTTDMSLKQFKNILLTIINELDLETKKHIDAVSYISIILAKQSVKESPYLIKKDPNFMEKVELAANLHDIGKVIFSKELFNNDIKLAKKSFTTTKEHINIGVKSLKKASFFRLDPEGKDICTAIKNHHPTYDSSLNIKTLKPIDNILIISDCVTAMATRNKRDGFKSGFKEVKAIIADLKLNSAHNKNGLKMFHPEYANIMIKILEKNPSISEQLKNYVQGKTSKLKNDF